MRKKLFCIYDAKADFYHNPIVFHTDAEAVRGFADLARDKNTHIGAHPEDYTLFEIGIYDNSSCSFELHRTQIPLGKGIDFIQDKEPLAETGS
jgi:hypothetical protein